MAIFTANNHGRVCGSYECNTANLIKNGDGRLQHVACMATRMFPAVSLTHRFDGQAKLAQLLHSARSMRAEIGDWRVAVFADGCEDLQSTSLAFAHGIRPLLAPIWSRIARLAELSRIRRTDTGKPRYDCSMMQWQSEMLGDPSGGGISIIKLTLASPIK